MNSFASFQFFGESQLDELSHSLGSSHSGLTVMLITIGALLLVVVALFIWAAAYRKPHRKHHRHHHHHHHQKRSEPERSEGKQEEQEEHRSHSMFRSHRRRRRRRSERPRNPTLAETGGLPPVRSNPEEPPAPTA